MNPMRLMQLCCALMAAAPAFAQSTYEREMRVLREQRDKAVADSTKALNARYQASLEQVYRRAVQAKDAGADAIKAELETLGPLRTPDGATPAPAASTGQLPRTMLGRWKVVHIGGNRETWEFKEDATVAITKGTSQIPDKFCTWAKVKDNVEVRYPEGAVTALAWPIKAGKLQGTKKDGGQVWLEKDK